MSASGLEFIDCAALDALRRCQAQAWAAGADLLLAAPGGAVARLLALTDMADQMWIYGTMPSRPPPAISQTVGSC